MKQARLDLDPSHDDLVERRQPLGGQVLDADVVQQGLEESKIEDMVVQAAVLEVVQRPFPELVEGAGRGVSSEIMAFEDLRQVREIVFTDTLGMILHEMAEGRRLAPMVEHESLVG